MLPALAERYRVTRVNLPGYGASSPAPPESVREYTDYVASVIDALALPKATAVFGNGLGGLIALQLGIGYGARFDRLIVAGALGAFPAAARASLLAIAETVRAKGMSAVLDAAMARAFSPGFAGASPELVAARKARLAAVDAQCFAHACVAMAHLDLRPQLGTIRNPTLVVCGEHDQTTPPALAREVAQAVPGAIYREISDCGHCPMLEQPAQLVELINEFMAARH
jgi:3-oxoadipate enol-lactonase